ncbi:MAG: hypothetical protein F7B60_05825 [Desulfurococcales archaeon]|nr:hypothetical protein [Desulfurococcales archaeon]
MPGLVRSLLLELNNIERLVYLRGLLPFPLSYKTLFRIKETDEREILENLALKNVGIIDKSADGYEVYISEAELIAKTFPIIARGEGLELSQRAMTVLWATAEAHGYLMKSITHVFKGSSLMSVRKKVDRGRPPLKVDINICFLQAGVGSLLQAVLHVPSLYEKISEEDVFELIKNGLHKDMSIREASKLIGGGIQDLDRITKIILKKCGQEKQPA